MTGDVLHDATFDPCTNQHISSLQCFLLMLPFLYVYAAQLLDTKSTDRKMTLLHYIALIVKEKYPELANFHNELHFVDKAAAGELRQRLRSTPTTQKMNSKTIVCSLSV